MLVCWRDEGREGEKEYMYKGVSCLGSEVGGGRLIFNEWVLIYYIAITFWENVQKKMSPCALRIK